MKNVRERFLTYAEFSHLVGKLISKVEVNSYAIVVADLDNFNFVNDLFGYDKGDRILRTLEDHYAGCLDEGEYFARMHADHFVFFVTTKGNKDLIRRFVHMSNVKERMKNIIPTHYNFVISGGITLVNDKTESIGSLIDKANFARKHAKGNHANTFLFYSKLMKEELEWKKHITFSIEAAIAHNEFEMYIQPKIHIDKNEIVGAEALVRWNSPTHGMINPDRFIPILEQNGFIKQIDFFMLEQVCILINTMRDRGKKLLPFSVNFSKVHLSSDDFVERVYHIVSTYKVKPSLIEIELTESVFSDDLQEVINTATAFKGLGFKLSLDDFGRAYSALNYLKDVPLDIIKIDKSFFDATTDSNKGKLIIRKVVELVKSLNLISVMEGIETQEQVDFLKELQCDLGQGYFYARPMPVDAFLNLLDSLEVAENEKDARVFDKLSRKEAQKAIPKNFDLNSWEVYILGNDIDVGLIKCYMDDDSTIRYINNKALDYLGYGREDFPSLFKNSMLGFVHPDDKERIHEIVESIRRTEQSVNFNVRLLKSNGETIYLQGRGSCGVDKEGQLMGIFAFQDFGMEFGEVNEINKAYLEKIRELEAAVNTERFSKNEIIRKEETYRLALEQMNDIVFEWDFKNDNFILSDKYKELMGREPVGYGVKNNEKLRERIHPDDLEVFEYLVRNVPKGGAIEPVDIRVVDVRGDYVWYRVYIRVINDKNGYPDRTVGVLSNISAQKMKMDSLTMKSQLDPLTKLLNKEEARILIEACLEKEEEAKHAFIIIDIDNFKGINDNLGHQFGDTVLQDLANKIEQSFGIDGILGRLGGDEFIVLIRNFVSKKDVAERIESLLTSIRYTYFGATSKYKISGSVGVAIYPEHGKSFKQLYQLSDVALYKSKARGKDTYTFYVEGMESDIDDMKKPVEASQRFITNYFSGDPVFNIFEMLYETKDIDITIKSILEMLGKRFGVDRVYIFEKDPTQIGYINNTYEWCAEGINPEISNLQLVEKAAFDDLFNQYNEEGILVCSDINTFEHKVASFLEVQGIKSMLHCAITNEGKFAGFIGFDLCNESRMWHGDEIATLGYISRVLSVFLVKTQIGNELLESYVNHVEMLENLNGFVYVVDSDNYEVLYVNQSSQGAGMKVGNKCYHDAFGIDEPCENCPVKQLIGGKLKASTEIYSELISSWVNSAASKVNWAGKKNAALVCCTDITKYKL